MIRFDLDWIGNHYWRRSVALLGFWSYMMQPAPTLRFVNRQINRDTYRILQQQWIDDDSQETEWRDVPTEDAAEQPPQSLPESVRIPLHSLQADLGYLIGRVIADSSCGPMIMQSMKRRLDQIESYWLDVPTEEENG